MLTLSPQAERIAQVEHRIPVLKLLGPGAVCSEITKLETIEQIVLLKTYNIKNQSQWQIEPFVNLWVESNKHHVDRLDADPSFAEEIDALYEAYKQEITNVWNDARKRYSAIQ